MAMPLPIDQIYTSSTDDDLARMRALLARA
jgi:hypothetical protein